MENLKVNEINFDNHVQKCRICCSNSFEKKLGITKKFEVAFLVVTGFKVSKIIF